MLELLLCPFVTGPWCIVADNLIKAHIYSDYVQYVQRHAICSLTWLPTAILNYQMIFPTYLAKCRFLPKLDNELPDERNSTFKQRFTRLQNLVIIMAQLEDWIGIKSTLDEAGEVKFISVPGNHLGLSKGDLKKHVIPWRKRNDISSVIAKCKGRMRELYQTSRGSKQGCCPHGNLRSANRSSNLLCLSSLL